MPEPDSPVNTTILLRGTARSTFFRLCSRAPWMVIFRSFGICEMSATNEESVLRIGALRISRDRNVSLLITRSITTSPPPDFDVLRPVTTPPFLAHPIINGRSCSTIPDFKTNVEHQFDGVSHIQTHGLYTVRSVTPPNTQKPDGHQTIRLCTAKPHHGRSATVTRSCTRPHTRCCSQPTSRTIT